MLLARLALVAMLGAAFPAPLPPIPPHPVVDSYPGGVKITDPYRQLENLKNAAVHARLLAEGAYTQDVLKQLGAPRVALHARIERYLNAGASVSGIIRTDKAIFYLERPVGANDARLMIRSNGGTSRVLLDPDALGKKLHSAAHLSISNVLPSPDGSLVAVGIVPGGAENLTQTRFVRTATGELLSDDLPRTWFGVTAWSPDSTTVFYNQLQAVAPGHEAEGELNSKVFRHQIGTSDMDVAMFGIGVDPNVPMVPTDDPAISIPAGSSYAVGVVGHGVQNEATAYSAPVAAVLSGGQIPWRKIVDIADDVTGFDVHDHTAYLLSHRDAPNYKVEALDLSDDHATAATSATTVVPAGRGVIKAVAVANDALYITGLDGGPATLRKMPWSSDGSAGPIASVTLPFAGTIEGFAADPRADGAVIELAGWTHPAQVDTLDTAGALTDTRIRKRPNIDTTPYTSLEVTVPSTNGARVPVSIVIRRGTKLDGSNPTYLEAYGSYGLDIDPYFLGPALAWLDAGGVYVVAHVRGGGEYGEAWHLAGKGPTKQHTIDDAIATARYLIAQRYTSSAHLAIEGTSAGGIMVGGAITQHPELFAAALDAVGVTDALRSETEPNGPGNVPEFGSSKNAAGFHDLQIMDAYIHIVKGRKYPAVMGITGINDPRVAPWQVAKFVTRLRASTASGRPVLMRVDPDAGHGLLAASTAQEAALLTDEFSFLLWQCGSPAFASVPKRIDLVSNAR